MSGSIPASLTAEAADPALAGGHERPRAARLAGREAWRRFRRHKLAIVSVVVLVLMLLGITFGALLWTTPIDEIDFAAKLQGPSWTHPLGTDDLGQDLLARMIHGGRISMAVGLSAMLVAVFVGVLMGAVSGMAGGRIDAAMMWVTDLFLALPQLPLLLLLIYLFRDALRAAIGQEGGIFLLIVVVIGGLRWMPLARLVRAQFLSLAREGIRRGGARARRLEAAADGAPHPAQRARPGHRRRHHRGGERDHRRIRRSPSSASASRPTRRPGAACCYDAKDYLDIAPHWALFPGAAIFLAVLSINFIGDGLRDALDPRRVL